MSCHDHKLVFHRSEFNEVAALLQLLVCAGLSRAAMAFSCTARTRASVRPKLLELGARTLGGPFLGLWYSGV